MRVCAEPGCPDLAGPRASRCHAHDLVSPRNHGGVSRHDRGHGSEFEARRRELVGRPCALRLPGCTGVSESADYTVPGDWSSELQPACLHCQRAQGAAIATAGRGAGLEISPAPLPPEYRARPDSSAGQVQTGRPARRLRFA